PCTKYNYMVRDVHELAGVVHEAFYLATSGRPGPVLIDVPKDVTAERIPLQKAEAETPQLSLPGYRPLTVANQEQVEQALNRVLAAKQPVFYVGGGIIHSGASEELMALAHALHIPVTPTLMGLGCFPAAHPLSMGMLGMHGTYWANMAMTEADLILAIGVRFDDRVTGALEKFAPNAEIVHVDIDASSLGKNVPTHWAIEGDAKAVMQQMLNAIEAEGCRPSPERLDTWWSKIAEWKARAPLTYEPSKDVIKPQQLC